MTSQAPGPGPGTAALTPSDFLSLIDDPAFLAIGRRIGGWNAFEAIGAVRSELRHSDFLAHILDPLQPHGFGPEVLRALLRAILGAQPDIVPGLHSLSVALGVLQDIVVRREFMAIDVLVEVPELDLVIAIENKVGAAEGAGQLARYRAAIDRAYPSRRKLLLFLTPDRDRPGEDGSWVPVTYSLVADVLEHAAEAGPSSAPARDLLNDYVRMLRRNVVQDEAMEKLAQEVIKRHLPVVQFLAERLPSPRRDRAALLEGLIKEADDLELLRPGETFINFAPKSWRALPHMLSANPTWWTKTGHCLTLEFRNPGDRVQLALVLGATVNPEVRQRIHAGTLDNRALFTRTPDKVGAYWNMLWERRLLSATDLEREPAEVEQLLRKSWAELRHNHLPRLDGALRKILESF